MEPENAAEDIGESTNILFMSFAASGVASRHESREDLLIVGLPERSNQLLPLWRSGALMKSV